MASGYKTALAVITQLPVLYYTYLFLTVLYYTLYIKCLERETRTHAMQNLEFEASKEEELVLFTGISCLKTYSACERGLSRFEKGVGYY